MKYWGISCGKIVEGFDIFPTISVSWVTIQVDNKLLEKYKRYYDIQFVWLFWYFTIGQIKNKLEERVY